MFLDAVVFHYHWMRKRNPTMRPVDAWKNAIGLVEERDRTGGVLRELRGGLK